MLVLHGLTRALRIHTPTARALSATVTENVSTTTALDVTKTHEVLNQASAFEGRYSLFHSDDVLREAVQREAGEWAVGHLESFGEACGTLHSAELARSANRHKPQLHTHDRFGRRIETAEFHPAYHELMSAGIQAGITSAPWNDPRPGAQVARAATMYLHNQAEAGTSCPMTMTYACVPALRLFYNFPRVSAAKCKGVCAEPAVKNTVPAHLARFAHAHRLAVMLIL